MPQFDLDHVGVVTQDLDAGRAAFARLGFALTPRSLHSGAVLPGGPVEVWASGNHCAMLQSGYLEVLGQARAHGFSAVRPLLDRYEGIHMVVFSADATADELHDDLRARGIEAWAPRYLERPAAYGPAMEEHRLARFNNVYLAPEAFGNATPIFIEHLTPEVLWQPHLLDHPNGVTGLAELGLASPQPRATAESFGRLLGSEPAASDRGGRREACEIRLARTTLHVIDNIVWAARYPQHRLPWPAPAWIGFTVRSLSETADFLTGAGVEFLRERREIWVAPVDACGAALRFFIER